jgi:repressor LexA
VVAAADEHGMKVLRLLARREARNEEPPSVREVAREAGYASSRSGQRVLEALECAGLVRRGEALSRKRRPVGLTERGWEALGEAPLLGRVAAGRGLEAIEDAEAYSLAGGLLSARGGRRRYLLRVVGDSMVGAGIADGDLLVVEEDEDPPDGEVVVALIGGGEEVTVKRIHREGERVRLKPQNGEHADIVVPAGDVVIQGRAVGVIHPFGRRL